MKRLLLVLFLLIVRTVPANAQSQYGWCGYVLLQGLPLLENQLAVFEAITPPPSGSVNPFELFQYRFSLDHSEVIVEGCFGVPPNRQIVEALLAEVIPASPSLIQFVQAAQADLQTNTAQLVPAQLGLGDATATPEPTATPLDPQEAVQDYIDENLTLTIFAPGGTDQESAAAARAYLEANDAAWNPPPDP